MGAMKPLAESVKLIRHKSPAHCLGRFFRLSASTVLKGHVGDMPATEVAANMTRQGFWGFADPKRLTIHFWTGPKVHASQLAMFFGHELGHIYDERGRQLRKRPKWMPAGEWRADAWGEVARQAMKWAKRYGRP